jgi:hypothetical protein
MSENLGSALGTPVLGGPHIIISDHGWHESTRKISGSRFGGWGGEVTCPEATFREGPLGLGPGCRPSAAPSPRLESTG